MPPTVAPDSVPRRRLETRVRKYRGTLFLASAAHAFELDAVAEFIFRQVDGVRTLRQIGERVAAEYGIRVEQAIADIGELLAQLAAHGVMEITP